mgnify:CR=1 FL=1
MALKGKALRGIGSTDGSLNVEVAIRCAACFIWEKT